jgi:hypothetical protein
VAKHGAFFTTVSPFRAPAVSHGASSMKKKKLFLGLVVVAGVLQFIRPDKNLSSILPGKNDLVTLYPPSPEVRRILETACYDCHSNHTRYPWYAEVQPVGWWLASHVNDGKGELNFSEFGTYPAKLQGSKMGKIADALTERSMPLKSYTWIHRDAIFTDAQNNLLIDWAEALQEKVEEGK